MSRDRRRRVEDRRALVRRAADRDPVAPPPATDPPAPHSLHAELATLRRRTARSRPERLYVDGALHALGWVLGLPGSPPPSGLLEQLPGDYWIDPGPPAAARPPRGFLIRLLARFGLRLG